MSLWLLYRSDLRRRWTRRSHHQQRRGPSLEFCVQEVRGGFRHRVDADCGCGCGSGLSEASPDEKLLPNPKIDEPTSASASASVPVLVDTFALPPHLQVGSNVSPYCRLNWQATSALFRLLEVPVESYVLVVAEAESLAEESLAEESLAEESLAEESLAEESPAEESLAEETAVAEETEAEESLAEESLAEESLAEESLAEEAVPDESNAVAEESLAEEAVAEETVAEETVAEETADAGSDDDDSPELVDLARHAILGEGAFGQVQLVSKVQANGTRRAYALKVQSTQTGDVDAIMREMTAMNVLSHPFINCAVNEFQDENDFYFLLPFLQGGELTRRFKMDSSGNWLGLPEEQAKFYALCIADALAYMHSLKCAHRDVKPDNIMIDSRGYPVLVDFGMAKFVHEKEHSFHGTPRYMAPEVYLQLPCGHDCSADHWSFGALVYELVSGACLLDANEEDWDARLDEVFNKGNLKIPDHASNEVVDLIRKLLVKDPTLRLGSLQGGEQDILEHPWFDGLDLVSLRQRKFSNVPWVPKLEGPLDTSNFPLCQYL